MTNLDAAQSAFVGAPPNVPDGVEWPEVAYEIHDLGDLEEYDFFRHRPPASEAEVASVAGYCAVLRHGGKWFAHRQHQGGASGSIGYTTREEAITLIKAQVTAATAFWMEKVGWKLAGDKAEARDRWGRYRQQVIRCGGYHYTIGREPSDSDYEANRVYGVFGFGGAQMAWRLLATGEVVQGRNCWGQGHIPTEFRDLLPDNAERIVSDQEKRNAEWSAKWRAEHAAREKSRAETRAALAPFSASGREHPFPDQVLMRVEDMDEDYDAEVGGVRTETCNLDEANVVTSKMQPYVMHDVGDADWHRPVLDLDLSAKLLPSSTPGHFHLFIDSPMQWDVYVNLLEALAEAGIVEPGYVKASIERGHTAVRLPWVRKGDVTSSASDDFAHAALASPQGGGAP